MARRPRAKPTEETAIRCRQCGKEQAAKVGAKGPLCPRGWSNIAEKESPYHAGFWCEACWDDTFVPRSITIPVAGPSVASGTWEELRKTLRQCWDWSTAVANWATTELARNDTPRTADAKKLAPAPSADHLDLYARIGCEVALIAPKRKGFGGQRNRVYLKTIDGAVWLHILDLDEKVFYSGPLRRIADRGDQVAAVEAILGRLQSEDGEIDGFDSRDLLLRIVELFDPKPRLGLVAPGMDSQAKTAVLHTIQQNYAKKRFDVLWSRAASFPHYDWPYPYATSSMGWEPVRDEKRDNRPSVSVQLAGKRWVLRLAGGFRNRRKIDGWKRIASGECLKRECAVLAETVTKSDHRNGVTTRTNSGGQRRVQRVMVKISAWFPRKDAAYKPEDEPRSMVVKTAADSFLSYRIGTTGEWRSIHADHIRRMRNQHFAASARFARDKKHEKRWPKRVLRQMLERQEKQGKKFEDRMDTWLHEVSKIVAEYAYRRRVTHVVIDLRDRSFGGDCFPWSKLKGLLEYKLHERRIAHEYVEDTEETPEVQGVRKPGRARKPATTSP